ncbi:MAG: carboxy-S-adenosyl-L-methionine synthase CmoA [Gammaproteobacteria bacterium]|nr:carboxy-S-adenosyl-L-methionine synthase CmoA [Gammaproteobacteria bacterium]
MSKDNLYKTEMSEVQPFEFNDDVVAVFPDMIRRSVPGYGSIVSGITSIGSVYLKDHTNCFDLGCSLGAVSIALSTHLRKNSCNIYAVDSSKPMLKKLEKTKSNLKLFIPIHSIFADINNIKLKNASLVIMNFTLQFIPLEERLNILTKIHSGMNLGGALIISEKVDLSDEEQHFAGIHEAFKSLNGYSKLEISQKRTALENVLIPESAAHHRSRLEHIGFSSVTEWFRAFNFVSLLAIK